MPPRALALLPAAFFFAAAAYNVRAGTPHTVLWICNVSNVLLAASLAAAWPRGVFIATLWLLAGMPLWIIDAVLTRELLVHSFLTHIVAAVIGLLALRRMPRPRPNLWWQAVVFGLFCQLLARLFTPPEANVNVAFGTYHSLAGVLPGFAAGWVVSLTSFIVGMFVLELAVRRILARSS